MIKEILEYLRNKWIFQPFLLSAYIVLVNVYDFGVLTVKWNEALLIFIGAFLIWSLVFFLVEIFFKDYFKSSYTASFIVFTTFFFTSIYETVFFISWIRGRHVIIIVTIVFIGLVVLSIRDKINLRQPRRKIVLFLNIVFIYLNIRVGIKILSDIITNDSNSIIEISTAKQTTYYPDVYLFILDGYANEKSLKKYWNFDNHQFIKHLSDLGFYYAPNSKSNYCFTIQSLASLLNLNYLKNGEMRGEEQSMHKIKSNETISIFKHHHYKIFNFSLADIDEHPNTYNYFPSSTFYSDVFGKTVFYYMIHPAQKGINGAALLNRDLDIKNKLEPIVASRDTFPKFIIYHSLLIHFPYYLDENGKISQKIEDANPSIETLQSWQSKRFKAGTNKNVNTTGTPLKDSLWTQGYLNHLLFANNFELNLIDNVIKNNRKPPIVIVLSDHGFRFMVNQPIQDVESERYSNFCAVYFPDKDYKAMYDSITPINVMRAVLNKALSTQLERVPDRSGLSTNN